MLNSAIELIKNSVTTVVGLTVGLLGLGGGQFDLQTANLVDTTAGTAVTEETVSEGTGSEILSENSKDDLEEKNKETISVEGDTKVEDSTENVAETEESKKTKYFERVDVKDPVFTRPTTATTEGVTTVGSGSVAMIDESSVKRTINPIKPTKTKKEVDVSLLLSVDFDKFNPQLKITNITENEENYFGEYQFRSFAIKNSKWQGVLKKKDISVNKVALENRDLGDYLSEELGEVVENEIIFLKEVQAIQREKQMAMTDTSSRDYSALVGKVLDIKKEKFNNYTPVVVDEDDAVTEAVVADVSSLGEETKEEQTVEDNTTLTAETISSGSEIDNADTQAPLIVINGNNPALIQIGSSYSELGATAVDDVSNNIEVVVGGDVVNTAVAGSYYVTYTATDEANNTATATKEVIVYDYGEAPEVEQVKDEVVGEISEEETEEVVVEADTVAEAEEEIEEESSARGETTEETSTSADIIVDAEVTELVTEEVIAGAGTSINDEVATTTKDVREESEGNVATTTEEIVGESEDDIAIIAEEVAEEVAEEDEAENATVEVSDVVKEVTAGVVKGGEKVKDKTKEVAEMVKKVSDQTIEQVSEAVETVSEEISAMIKNINLSELLGNIRNSLQIDFSWASRIFDNLHQTVEGVADETTALIKNIKIFEMIGNIKSSLSASVIRIKAPMEDREDKVENKIDNSEISFSSFWEKTKNGFNNIFNFLNNHRPH